MSSPGPAALAIIIGAPRSGTNMLRDCLCRLPGFGTWPCDEINAIWRHGNLDWPDDEIPAERATPKVQRFVRGALERQRRRSACEVLIEKTCANTLRVPFVDRVFPEARFVFIHRDPLDAIASARRRWTAPPDLSYTLAKARFVPPTDVPRHALRFLTNRLRQRLSRGRRLPSWGPRPAGLVDASGQSSLTELCALQWAGCVGKAARDLARLPRQRVHVVAYEDFVAEPGTALAEIGRFLGHEPDAEELRSAVTGVHAASVGRGARDLGVEEQRQVDEIVAPARADLAALV